MVKNISKGYYQYLILEFNRSVIRVIIFNIIFPVTWGN